MAKHPLSLRVERLEDRDVPATFGTAWPDPSHLTVSFVPDGAAADGVPSTLFQAFNAGSPTAAWKTAILQALQTWAVNTPLNIGIVADGGQPIGSGGAIQGDSRFGDIRLYGRPLAPDVAALNSPYDPSAGTRSGDVQFNTVIGLGVSTTAHLDLYSAMLDEAGNLFGLADTSDPTSALFGHYLGVRAGLNSDDIRAIQALYGPRLPDYFEGATGNDTLADARAIYLPNVQADVTTNGDVDFYRYTAPYYADSTFTINVQTTGISLLAPKLTVLDSSGEVVGVASTTDPLAGGVTYQLTNVTPGGTYYFKVEGARSDVFGIGSYRLKIDSGPLSEYMIAGLDTYYGRSFNGAVQLDSHTNDTPGTATDLGQPIFRSDPRYYAAVSASVEDATDVDFYSLVTPSVTNGQSQTMVVSTAAINDSTLNPSVKVFDADGNPVAADIINNDTSTFVVQIPNAAPGARYYIQVVPDSGASAANLTGKYLLSVNFRAAPIPLPELAETTLSDDVGHQIQSLTVNQSEVTHFVLSASAPGATVTTAVRMTLFDTNLRRVFDLTAQDGQTVSGDVFLAAGDYTVVFAAATIDGSQLAPLTFNLRGKSITDPIDPVPVDPNAPPPPPPVVVSNPPPPNPTDPTVPVINPWVPGN